jgi:moderate conductance mechanosensitive channel
MQLLDEYPECNPDQAVSCRVTWQLTGNETLSDLAAWVIGKPLAILGLVLIGLLARWVAHRLIDRAVRRAEDGVLPGRITRMHLGRGAPAKAKLAEASATSTRRVQRTRTMGSLLKSISTGVILTIVVMMSISELGYDVAPLIASAGILGLALGFGAQSLVSDFLAGIFMIFEDQYGVGDEIDLGEAIGTVEAVSLRVTRLRDINGTVWYVRNGEILRVGNMSQNWARTVLDVQVGYHEDLARVRRVLEEVAHDVWTDDEFKGRVIEEPSVWGVQDLAADGVTVRVALKTAPLEQWGIAREMRQRIKARFDHEGIEIPFPQRTIWHRGNPVGQPQDDPQEGWQEPARS